MNGFDARNGVDLVLVDFDDTLVATGPRFQNARRTLFELMVGEGFDPDRAHRVHHDEVDREMLELHGLGPFRLEPSFRETYRRLCALEGRTPDPAIVERCVALARDVIGPPPCYDGAIEALTRLAAALDTVLYTQAGDPDYQLDCVRRSGVMDVIPPDRVRVCTRKTTAEFHAALVHFGVPDPGRACMVGNSIRSDINPALSAGARAILIEVDDPWIFDQVEPVSDAFVRVRGFPEAVQHLVGDGKGEGRGEREGEGVGRGEGEGEAGVVRG